MENMELWNQVCETDPDITKPVDTRGGFTSICAQAQKKRATSVFGMFGIGWGLKKLAWQYIRDNSGFPIELTLDAEFFWLSGEIIVDGEVVASWPGGSFEIGSDIGFKPGNDSKKKLRTDVITKALSDLGFNSDVFEGKFDDDKYVVSMREKFNPNDDKERFLAAVESLIEKGLALCDGDWGKRYLAVFGDCMDPKDFETDEKRKEYFIKLTDLVESLE